MNLLLDIGNSYTHIALANRKSVIRRLDIPTQSWYDRRGGASLRKFVGNAFLLDGALCSVVPRATHHVKKIVKTTWGVDLLEVNWRNIPGLKVDYPAPSTIGTDRLANAVAASHHYGVPVIVLDFGTALTVDVVDPRARFIGGIIAPGLTMLADCMHEHTALLPKITIRNPSRAIGRSTKESMRIGVVHGYRGMVKELLRAVLEELGLQSVRVVATGGYASFIASGVKEIELVVPNLTLEGVRLVLEAASRERLAIKLDARATIDHSTPPPLASRTSKVHAKEKNQGR